MERESLAAHFPLSPSNRGVPLCVSLALMLGVFARCSKGQKKNARTKHGRSQLWVEGQQPSESAVLSPVSDLHGWSTKKPVH